ncbi:hypothetical protein KI387_017243, partial [Taxus chinensis]
ALDPLPVSRTLNQMMETVNRNGGRVRSVGGGDVGEYEACLRCCGRREFV